MSIKQKSLEESQMKNLKSKDLVHFTTGQGSHNGYIIDELMGKVTATKKTVSLKTRLFFFAPFPIVAALTFHFLRETKRETYDGGPPCNGQRNGCLWRHSDAANEVLHIYTLSTHVEMESWE